VFTVQFVAVAKTLWNNNNNIGNTNYTVIENYSVSQKNPP